MRTVVVAFLLMTRLHVLAGDTPKYPVKDIPDDMKLGMYAVVRESKLSFDILSRNSSRVYLRKVITILNPKGKNYASFGVFYDEYIKIENIRGFIYDAEGNLIRKLKSSDISDQSAADGYSLFEENRVKEVDLSYGAYPYTVEYEYEVQQRYLYMLPRFHLYDDDEVSIQKSSFEVAYPSGNPPIYRLHQVPEPTRQNLSDGRNTLRWSFENIKPSKFESNSPDLKWVVPTILISPSEFEWDGYSGKMDSWENFGKWQIMLNKGRDVLPDGTRAKVKELTGAATTVEDKTRILYDYLQNKTRYVYIEEGLGGFQPFPASVVDAVGYGDCKALSNYMIALLKEAGIKGYYTKIYSGDDNRDVIPDFITHYFNHIIVSVPNGADTIWLECTSQTEPFGYLGRSTSNRHALMITENGGKLVRTPSYSANQNIQNRYAEVRLDLQGNATAKVQTTYKGLQYEVGNLNFIINYQHDDKKKWIQNNTNIPSFDIASFSMENRKDRIPSAVVKVDYVLNRFATISGKRIFITPNLMNKNAYVPEKLDARKSPIVRKLAYTNHDTIQFRLPEEVYPEFLPEPVKIQSRFGEYESTYKIDQGSLIYTRKLRMNEGEFPPDTYQEFVDFFRNITKADNTKLVFLSKT